MKRGDIRYFADLVKDIRNMVVHPGNYIRLYTGVHITKAFVDTVEETVSVVVEVLDQKLQESIKDSPEFREWKASHPTAES